MNNRTKLKINDRRQKLKIKAAKQLSLDAGHHKLAVYEKHKGLRFWTKPNVPSRKNWRKYCNEHELIHIPSKGWFGQFDDEALYAYEG